MPNHAAPQPERQQLVELDHLYQTAPIGLCLLDRDLRFVRINELLARFHGRPVAEHLGRTLREVIPEIADKVEPLFHRVLETGDPIIDVEIQGTTPAEPRRERYWLASYYPLVGDDGAVHAVSTVVQDITERKVAARALQERLRFEELLSSISAAFINLPADEVDREVLRALEVIVEFLGVDRAGLIEVSESNGSPPVTHAYVAPGIPQQRAAEVTELPWLMDRMRRGEAVLFSRPEDLPAEAVAEKRYFAKEGLRSAISIPLSVGGSIVGLLGFSTFRSERSWPNELVDRLRLLGGVLANAIMRRRSERALRRSEARYRAIVEDQEEFIVRWLPDGTRTFVNDAYCRHFETSREELIGTSFFPLVAESDRLPILEKIRRLTPANPVEVDEHRMIRSDGTVGWQLSSDRGIFDRRGRLVELQSVGRDITPRKRAEQALLESEERFRILVEHAPEAIVVLDVDEGRFVDANENAVRLFKLSREELHKTGPVQLSPPFQPDGRSSELVARSIDVTLTGATPVFEWVHRDAEGTDIPCEVRLVRLPSSDRKLVRGSLTDITERKRLEDQLRQSQKMEALGLLAGGIAHDFNNLLTAISGNAELALAEVDHSSTIVKELQEIAKAGERAASLTRQLLTFSRTEVAQPQVLDLNTVVENVGRLLRRLIGEDVRLTTKLGSTIGRIEADPYQIEQVVLNLAINARDAMPHGGELAVETTDVVLDEQESDGRPGPYVLLQVSDTGVGMATEIRTRIFEPFFTTKERGRGTGLGLSTVYGIVKQNRGLIRTDTEVGRGTTFRVYLPRCDRRIEDPGERRHDVEPGTETILLVEDEALVRDLARRSLQDYGYAVLDAASGEEALRIAERNAGAIDLLLTDVVMPGMNGRVLADRLSSIHPATAVLYVSGYANDVIKHRGLGDGAVAFLEKPYSPKILARKVREVLDGRRSE